jgi:selenocysteine lyase/cysteine desulfurase
MAFDLTALRAGYGAFLRDGRVLLTGHSHQAWPDVARDAQIATFDDAARFVDDKWGAAVFPKIESVSRRVLARMGFAETDGLALGKSTHELVFRLLSCLKWHEKPRVVTTTSEFHSLHRQLSRLAEEGVEVVWVDATDRATLAERVIAACTPGTAMVALSAVLFEDSFVVRDLGEIVAHAAKIGAIPLIDAYHAFNVVPVSWGPAASAAFVTAGGYKYAQFGEGICWLRVPEGSTLRPAYTGWFADFEALEGPRTHHVGYGPGGARFTGATFDPSSVYRADAVLAFQDAHGLDVATLRAISIRQTSRIIARLDERGAFEHATLASSRDPDRRGGFVTLKTPLAQDAVKRLRERNVFTDARGDGLRLGPAPYLTDAEIDAGVDAVAAVLAG